MTTTITRDALTDTGVVDVLVVGGGVTGAAIAYEAASAEGMHVKEVTTASGREAAAEFKAFFQWFMTAIGEGN